MSMDRRQFIKIAGLGAVLGLGGVPVLGKLQGAGKALAGSEYPEFIHNPKALTAKKWGIVIDVSKIKTELDYRNIIEACNKAHNVPSIPDPRHEVKWIWKDDYEHTFPNQGNRYMDDYAREKKPFLVLCNHCERPACVRVCPTKATFKRSDGIVVMDYHRCIGCRFCMAACPFGARSFNWVDPKPYIKEPNAEFPARMRGVVEKCTFCSERLDKGLPLACAEVSNGAIVFGDLEDPQSEVRKLLATRYTIRRKPELGTGPNVYYVIGGTENAG
jgi:molybdopterin-containing oxidoreductase family iron-sulfur binding subunit